MKKGFSWVWVIVLSFIVILIVLGYLTFRFYPSSRNGGSTDNPTDYKSTDFLALCTDDKGKTCKASEACKGNKEMFPGGFECCLGTCEKPTSASNLKICAVAVGDTSACKAECDICVCSNGNSRIYKADHPETWNSIKNSFACLLNFVHSEPWWFPAQLYSKNCPSGKISGFCRCGNYACGDKNDNNYYCENSVCRYKKESAVPSSSPSNSFYDWPTYEYNDTTGNNYNYEWTDYVPFPEATGY